jgi:hypothetical protein
MLREAPQRAVRIRTVQTNRFEIGHPVSANHTLERLGSVAICGRVTLFEKRITRQTELLSYLRRYLWLKEDGAAYQTRMNRILREAMQRERRLRGQARPNA